MKLLTFKPPFRLTLTWLTIYCNWTQTSRPFADTKANASVFFIFPHRSFFNSILSRHTLHTFASHTNPPHRPKLAKECNLSNAFTKFVAWNKFWHSYSVFTFWLCPVCRAATRTTVIIWVATNQTLPPQTIQTTTATPRIALLFVCVLAADNLLVIRLLPSVYRFTFLFH